MLDRSYLAAKSMISRLVIDLALFVFAEDFRDRLSILLKQLSKVVLLVNLHFLELSIGQKLVGQVEDRARMAAVHETREHHTRFQRNDEGVVEIVVTKESHLLIIERNEGFVITIVFFAPVIITELASMAL